MIKAEENKYALQSTIPSALEGKLLANLDSFFRLPFTSDVSFILNL